MATGIETIKTKFGAATVRPGGAGQLPIHTMANWMWLPMLMMGAMSLMTAIGLGIAQANVGSDLGEEFTALRQANFETLGPLVRAFLFLGVALLLTGISFLLGTILGALRWGGGEVQESIGAPVKTLKMPLTAKIFLMLMMMGLMTELVAFGTMIFVANQAHSAWISAAGIDSPGNAAALHRAVTYGAWASPLRLVAVGMILTSIAFALYTISNVLGFQFSRIRELITGQEEGGS